jgi:hypothetical protein
MDFVRSNSLSVLRHLLRGGVISSRQVSKINFEQVIGAKFVFTGLTPAGESLVVEADENDTLTYQTFKQNLEGLYTNLVVLSIEGYLAFRSNDPKKAISIDTSSGATSIAALRALGFPSVQDQDIVGEVVADQGSTDVPRVQEMYTTVDGLHVAVITRAEVV